MSQILQWVKDLPNTVKAIIGLLTTIIPAVIMFRNNFNLAVVVVSAIIVVAALSYLAYVVLARHERVPGFTQRRIEAYKYPGYRRWALGGICAIALAAVFVFVFKPTRYYIMGALRGIEVAPHAAILVAQFDAKLASRPYDIPRRIETNLADQLEKHGLQDVKVEVVSRSITSEKEAQEVAEQADAEVVVWGSYDDIGVTVNIYTPQPPSSGKQVLQMKEVPWAQGPQALSEVSLQIRERLPNDITFLSLFIIGSLEYEKNEYQKGHQAFDAAMANLPKDIGLKNEALLHFFSARGLGFSNPQNFERAICEYSKAIERSPNFAAAYNNLGIMTTKIALALSFPDRLEKRDSRISGETDKMRECLRGTGYASAEITNETPRFFFAKALAAQPDSAGILFNKVASDWSLSDSIEESDRSEFVANVDKVLSRDPSIPGAHIMRGVLAFEKDRKEFADTDFQIALREFSAASQLMPNSYELHVNLGKVYLRKKQYADARAEFEKSLALAQNSEARLGLADVAIRQGEIDLAFQHLDAVNSDRENATAVRVAAILRSRISFDAGRIAEAIQTLQTNLSEQPEPVAGTVEGVPENNPAAVEYLIGLLYQLGPDMAMAHRHADEANIQQLNNDREERDSLKRNIEAAISVNDTSGLVWYELEALCSFGNPIPCQSPDMRLRIKKTFDLVQDRIAIRIFYRRKVEFAGFG